MRIGSDTTDGKLNQVNSKGLAEKRPKGGNENLLGRILKVCQEFIFHRMDEVVNFFSTMGDTVRRFMLEVGIIEKTVVLTKELPQENVTVSNLIVKEVPIVREQIVNGASSNSIKQGTSNENIPGGVKHSLRDEKLLLLLRGRLKTVEDANCSPTSQVVKAFDQGDLTPIPMKLPKGNEEVPKPSSKDISKYTKVLADIKRGEFALKKPVTKKLPKTSEPIIPFNTKIIPSAPSRDNLPPTQSQILAWN